MTPPSPAGTVPRELPRRAASGPSGVDRLLTGVGGGDEPTDLSGHLDRWGPLPRVDERLPRRARAQRAAWTRRRMVSGRDQMAFPPAKPAAPTGGGRQRRRERTSQRKRPHPDRAGPPSGPRRRSGRRSRPRRLGGLCLRAGGLCAGGAAGTGGAPTAGRRRTRLRGRGGTRPVPRRAGDRGGEHDRRTSARHSRPSRGYAPSASKASVGARRSSRTSNRSHTWH